jgi:hypothetical protein
MDFDESSPDVQERARSCKTSAEVKAFAREVGQELADEQIQDIAAGAHWKDKKSCKSYIPCFAQGSDMSGFSDTSNMDYWD